MAVRGPTSRARHKAPRYCPAGRIVWSCSPLADGRGPDCASPPRTGAASKRRRDGALIVGKETADFEEESARGRGKNRQARSPDQPRAKSALRHDQRAHR